MDEGEGRFGFGRGEYREDRLGATATSHSDLHHHLHTQQRQRQQLSPISPASASASTTTSTTTASGRAININSRQHNTHVQLHHQYQQHQTFRPDDRDTFPTDPAPLFNAYPSSIPVASYAAANLQASASNSSSTQAFANFADPDDFYRSYRGVQTAAASASANAALLYPAVKDSMASSSAILGNRQTPAVRLAANNGTTGKHPVHAAATGHSALRPTQRSVSSPVGDETATTGPSSKAVHSGYGGADAGPNKPSVKDLKKRFDQNKESPSTSPNNPGQSVSARNPPIRDTTSTSNITNGRPPAAAANGSASYSALRSGSTREIGSASGTQANGTRGTQRAKFVPEDQLSSNSQSFASRISKPRNAVSPNAQASKSMTQLSPPKVASPPPTSPHRMDGLLFGEILPEQNDFLTVGYGIDGARQRRTSDSSVHNPARPHIRSLSDPDVEPPSPTDWYRGTPSQGRTEVQEAARTQQDRGHSRAQSDSTAAKPGVIRIQAGLKKDSSDHSQSSSPTTRLPVPRRKYASPSTSNSPASTRSNSPSTVKRPTASGRTSRQQHGPPVSRAKTPTKRSTTPTTRSKTPNQQSPAVTRRQPPSNTNPPGSSRLNAYVSIPAPKLSPSLRSSRPRQSVATATTAASRMKAVDRGPSPQRTPQRSTTKTDEPITRRRKISVGPIDFAQRRETIKLAYSKSIRESQAQEARNAAAAKREREMKAAAKAKAEAEAKAKAQEELAALANAAAASVAACTPTSIPTPVARSAEVRENGRPPEARVEQEKEPPVEALKIDMDIPRALYVVVPPPKSLDSPTLGIPGSFPALGSPPLKEEEEEDEVPQSALSTTSVATEFDTEPQTEPPSQRTTTISATTVEEPPAEEDLEKFPALSETPATYSPVKHLSMSSYKRSSYHSPFDMEGMSDENVSIKIALDHSNEHSVEPCPRPTPTRSEYESEAHYEPEPSPESEEELEQAQEPEPEQELERDPAPERHVELESVPEQEIEFEPAPEQEVEFEPALEQEVAFKSAPEPEPVIPGSFQDEYEPQPYTYTAPTYETTVTILGPETDFRPSHKEEFRDTLEEVVEGRAVEVPHDVYAQNALQLLDGASEQGKSSTDNLSALEDFYVGPNLRDNITALRASTFSSSDADTSGDAQPSSAEYQKTPDTSHSLSVPPLLEPPSRLSQFSAWTDFSLESSEGRDSGARGSMVNVHEPEIRDQSSIKLPPSAEAGPSDLDSESNQDVEISPLDTSSTIGHSMLTDSLLTKHRLPELDTGVGFSVPYFSREQLRHEQARIPSVPSIPSIPSLPEHDPPPPPDDNDDGLYTVETRPSSYLQSHDGTDEDLARSLSTPHSLSIETPDAPSASQAEEPVTTAESEMPEKERKRLKQRQLVIRELIDTESIFIRDMTVVEEIYKGTAEACPKLDGKTVKLVFRNSDDIIAFHTLLLALLKEGVMCVYAPKSRKTPLARGDSVRDPTKDFDSMTNGVGAAKPELSDDKDRMTSIGSAFLDNIDKLKIVHEAYLRTSDHSTKRLLQIQEDPTVKVWLNECNEVAKDLTSAWNLDSLLIKPMQRITKYPDIITHLLKYTPEDHPDHEPLVKARTAIMNAIDDINKTKKNFELVGQIVSNRKRKDSDVRLGIARAFGKRVDKLQTSKGPPEDDVYVKLNEKFGDDYLRLQVVLRDVEFYTRTVSAYVHEFLQYLSSIELVMRLQPSKFHSHLESKWVQFNVSMRDIEKMALEEHLSHIRKHVIEPFEQVIRCYTNPATAMRKRAKRRLDYERYMNLKANNKKIDKQLLELVEHYEALNETLKKELPQLSELTARIGNICLGKFVSIQAKWYYIWQEKIKTPLQDMSRIPEISEIVGTFQRDFKDVEDEILGLSIVNPALRPRPSQSTTDDSASILSKTRSRPNDSHTPRGRGLSVNSDHIPSLPTPDFVKRTSGSFGVSPTANNTLPSPNHYYRDYYSGINGHVRGGSSSPVTSDVVHVSRTITNTARPSTGRSYESSAGPRQSVESSAVPTSASGRRDSNPYGGVISAGSVSAGSESRRFSGIFSSALPLPDYAEEQQRASRASSRASSRERVPTHGGYNVMWLAASLFEFHIETTKHEAGYPYLTYSAGEIFDVIAEKGELWLAKNQDDPKDLVGWIWSKHFAKLADS